MIYACTQAIRDALENLKRNKAANLLCLGIISFTLLVLGIFRFIGANLNDYIKQHSRQVEAIFYLAKNAGQDEIESLRQRISNSLLVSEVRLITPEQARTRFSRDFPELEHLVNEYSESPFPLSIEVLFREDLSRDIQITAFIEDIRRSRSVESMEINIDWIRRLAAVKRFISLVGFFLTGILLFVTVFIIFNVIKMTVLFRRDEIQIMLLVGATRMYIRVPFLIEGSLLGLAGGLLGAGLLLALVRFLPASDKFVFNMVSEMISLDRPVNYIIREMLLIGTLIGLVSSWFSVEKHVR